MHTDLRQMRHVVTLGGCLSFTKAAEALGITQSTLTRSIQSIETGAGVRLFDRDRGRVRLTKVGEAYVSRARSLLREAEELEESLLRSARAESGEVEFGIVPLVASAILPAILTDEVNQNPEVRCKVLIRSPDTLIELAKSESIEFCVCAQRPVDPEPLRTELLGSLPLSLLVRTGHPLLSSVNDASIELFPFITSGQIYASPDTRASVAHLTALQPRVVIDDFRTLAHITSRTDAVWLSSRHAAFEEIHAGRLEEYVLPGSKSLGSFRIAMYLPPRRSLSQIARRLAARMRAELIAMDARTCDRHAQAPDAATFGIRG